jgi:uncharacterized protein (DUF433 family)
LSQKSVPGSHASGGLRITVWDVLGWMAAGMNQEQILADYPELEPSDFPAVFDCASRVGRRVAL